MLTNRRISLKPFVESDCIKRRDAANPGLPNSIFAFGAGATQDAGVTTDDAFGPFSNFVSEEYIIRPEVKKFDFVLVSTGTVNSCQTIGDLDTEFGVCTNEQLTCPENSPCCDDCVGRCCEPNGTCENRTRAECNLIGGANFGGCNTDCEIDNPCGLDDKGHCCTTNPACPNCESCSVTTKENCTGLGLQFTLCEDQDNCACGANDEPCDTSGCDDCVIVKCCFYEGDFPVACKEITRSECADQKGTETITCEACTDFCKDGSEYTEACCRSLGTECGKRCDCDAIGGTDVGDCDNCQSTERYNCVSTTDANGCTLFKCEVSALGIYATKAECEADCDPCGPGGACKCDFSTGKCIPDPAGTFCCNCAACSTNSCNDQKSDLAPVIIDTGDIVTDEYFKSSGASFTPANIPTLGAVDSSAATKALTTSVLNSLKIEKGILFSSLSTSTKQDYIQTSREASAIIPTPSDVEFGERVLTGAGTCNMCDQTDESLPDFLNRKLPCFGGDPVMIHMEYDVSDLCTNDEVKLKVFRSGPMIILQVSVKWFGNEEETGDDTFSVAFEDKFVLPKNARYQENGQLIGGVIPSTLTAICDPPCGFTYECGGDVQPQYIFNPVLSEDQTQTGKARDIRRVSDIVGSAFPDREITARVKGIGKAYDEIESNLPIFFVDGNGDITSTRATRLVTNNPTSGSTPSELDVRAVAKTSAVTTTSILSNGADDKFIKLRDSGGFLSAHGQSCDCPEGGLAGNSNPREGCPAFDPSVGGDEERIGLFTFSGSF